MTNFVTLMAYMNKKYSCLSSQYKNNWFKGPLRLSSEVQRASQEKNYTFRQKCLHATSKSYLLYISCSVQLTFLKLAQYHKNEPLHRMAFFCSPCCHINAPIKDVKFYLECILSSTKFTFSKHAQCLQNEPLHRMSSFHNPPFHVNVPITYTSLFRTNSSKCSGQHQKL